MPRCRSNVRLRACNASKTAFFSWLTLFFLFFGLSAWAIQPLSHKVKGQKKKKEAREKARLRLAVRFAHGVPEKKAKLN